jgi:cystathionine beta-lyase/cystathionine gamma-synthase
VSEPTNPELVVLPQAFESHLSRAVSRLLHALPDDWQPQATTYDLNRFTTFQNFSLRFAEVVEGISSSDPNHFEPNETRARLETCGLPYDYARLGQPLSSVVELFWQAYAGAVRAFSFASQTKPWLSVIESLGRTLPVKLYAQGSLLVSKEKSAALLASGVQLVENWSGPIPPRTSNAISILVFDPTRRSEFAPRLWAANANEPDVDAVVFPLLRNGGMLLLRDTGKIDPVQIQLIRKRTVSALIAADAHAELTFIANERALRAEPTTTAQQCHQAFAKIFPGTQESLIFCSGLAAEAAVFEAVGDVLVGAKPNPVTLFYAQNCYGGTAQLIAQILAPQGKVVPAPLAVLGNDSNGNAVSLVDRLCARIDEASGQSLCVFIETPTNPELQFHDFEKLMRSARAYETRCGRKFPIILDTTLAPMYSIFAKDLAHEWPFLLVKSGSKYLTKGKATLGLVAAGNTPLALQILNRARQLAHDADSLAKPSQLESLELGLRDMPIRLEQVRANTVLLADGIRQVFKRCGFEVELFSTGADGNAEHACGLISFYLPPAPTTFPNLVDEFVADLLHRVPQLVKSRVSYGQSSGAGKTDLFYVINPEESTQGALSREIKEGQKRGGVQICRISVPQFADVSGLLVAIEAYASAKYGK